MNYMTIKILINRIEDIKEFSRVANSIPNVIDASSGRYSINGKSVMGLFGLDLSKPIVITVYGDITLDVEKSFRKFEVKE